MPQHPTDHAEVGEPPQVTGTEAPVLLLPIAAPRQVTDPDSRRAPLVDLGRC